LRSSSRCVHRRSRREPNPNWPLVARQLDSTAVPAQGCVSPLTMVHFQAEANEESGRRVHKTNCLDFLAHRVTMRLLRRRERSCTTPPPDEDSAVNPTLMVLLLLGQGPSQPPTPPAADKADNKAEAEEARAVAKKLASEYVFQLDK